MKKLAGFIVDKRNLIFLIFAMLVVFSAFSRNWVHVENDLTAYLPPASETRQALDLMEEEFTTFGTASVMVDSVSYEEAEALQAKLEGLEGVQSVAFDESADHFNTAAALFTVTFAYDENDDRCLTALDTVQEALHSYDTYVSTDLGDQESEIIADEMSVIIVIVAIVVLAVLLLTSSTWAEVPVLILTFVGAAILNMGTNFLLGTISFVSNSVTICLQLALSLDYAIIFCNRYKEEHQTLPVRDAIVVALSKAIPEICASSLTTIGGLAAMLFMQFRLGVDMGICLIKAILFSLISVFFLMPGLLMLFGNLMDKTKHRNLVPSIPFVGKFAYRTRHVVPIVFAVVVLGAFILSGKCPYVYGYETLTTPVLNDTQIAENKIADTFESDNMVAVVVPAGDYATERRLLNRIEEMPEVESAVGLANTTAMDQYKVTDRLTPRQFSELTDLDYELAETIYAAYAANDGDYGKIVGGISSYSIPLIDIFTFVYEQVQDGYVSLDSSTQETLDDAYEQLHNGRLQLQGEHYSRMLVYLNLPVGGDETFAFTDTLRETAQTFYPEGTVYVAGNATNEYDFAKSFERDNMVVTLISILIVLVVLLFTFQSVGMPILLILVIEGSIWINFSFPYLMKNDLFFMSYLVVSSIQMGANIDYAIVISNRYLEMRERVDRKTAVIETMNFAFPTILTSGTILAVAGTLIGQMTSEAAIVGIGQCLGRGTVISIILVMFVLPQLLLIGERIINKTSFSVNVALKRRKESGRMRLDGLVYGEISGTVSGTVHAIVDGDVNVSLISGDIDKAENTADGESGDPAFRENAENGGDAESAENAGGQKQGLREGAAEKKESAAKAGGRVQSMREAAAEKKESAVKPEESSAEQEDR
ncbi:MAG: MMPL family transporter [Eubacteriales bacterium]|nr:MMPL family transporter [Eubacteriales bacterium]